MIVRNCLFLLSNCIRRRIIIIVCGSFFFLFHLTFTSISSRWFPLFPLIQHALPNQTVVGNPFSLTNRTIYFESNRTVRLAVVSAIYNDDYIKGVEVLGYGLRRIKTPADLILLYISNRLSQLTLDRCRKAGWFLWSVERIDPPRFAIIYPRFDDQYTKLRIWSMIGCDRVLYLDADILGLLGAVADVWQGKIGPNFIAGVLLIRPNQTIFNDMMIKMDDIAAYGSYWAEQAFLNWYLKGSTGRLPLIYNFNNALAIYHHGIYSQLRDRMKIIHYTSDKPFDVLEPNQLSNPTFF